MEPLKNASAFLDDCKQKLERLDENSLPQGQYLGFYVPGMSLVMKRTDKPTQPEEGVMACSVSLLFKQ
jgi:hypothetical protein